VIIYQHRIYRVDLQNNPDVLYLFGDNLDRVGLGGQAGEMRGEPNAIGIATKIHPGMSEDDFFTDDAFAYNMNSIRTDLKPVGEHIIGGGIVVIPSDGLGTGLSQLPERAPRTYAFLEEALRILKGEPKTDLL